MGTESRTEQATKTGDRDTKTGRFLPGNKGGPGRYPNSGKSLIEALREQLDPDRLARLLLSRADVSDQVLMYLFDRLEGRPKQETLIEHKDEPPAIKAIRELQRSLANTNGHKPPTSSD